VEKTPSFTAMADKISLPDEASASLTVLQGLFVMPLPHLSQTQAQGEPCASRSPRLLKATRLAERDNALATDDICEGHTNYCGGLTDCSTNHICPPLRGMCKGKHLMICCSQKRVNTFEFLIKYV